MSDSDVNQTCNALQSQIDNARDKLQKIQYMDDRMISFACPSSSLLEAKQKYKMGIERDINAINTTV
jgi:hypothetical protein